MTKPYDVDDLLRFHLIRDLQVRPDGREIIAEIKSIDEKDDDYRSSLRVVSASGDTNVELVPATSNNTSAQWSPDGTQVAFLSTRSGPAALYLIRRDGGEAHLVKAFARAISSITWDPSGKRILATVTVDHDPDASTSAPKRVTRQRYKSDGVSDLLTSTTRLYWIDVDSGRSTELTDASRELMSAAISPDGRYIAFAQSRTGPRETHLSDIWVMREDGSDVRRVTTEIPSAMSPSWSPDGRYLAFVGNRDPGDSMQGLWLVDLADGNKLRKLGDDRAEVTSYPLTRSLAPLWSPDGKRVLYLSAFEGTSEIGAIEVATGKRQQIPVPPQIVTFHGAASTLAFVRVSAGEPGNVVVTSFSGGSCKQVTNLNTWWSERTPVRSERVKLGDDLAGWLISAADNTRPGPLFVDIHGGPQSFTELGFPYHVYWWVLCSRGWRILALNPEGSGSYGTDHARKLRGRWGKLDLPQQLAAIDELKRRGLADDRVVIGGKSYGGYLAAWAIGHTQRFRAAIVSAPVTNFESHAGTSDSGYYVDAYDLGGELYERHDLARELSPVQYAHRATTPTLILQGEADQRCPVGQSEELFAILMRVGKAPVEMILYPNGHHDLAEDGRPSHRVDYHRRIVEWCERWTTK